MKQNFFLKIILPLLFIIASATSYGQLATWDFTGDVLTSSSSASGVTASTATHVGLSNISYGSSCTGRNFNPGGWNTTVSINTADDYVQFVITADTGYSLSVTGFTYDAARTGTGPTTYDIRSSDDSYAASLSTGTVLETPCTSSGGTFTAINVTSGSSLTFRIYGYNASSAAGRMRIDNVSIAGTASLTTSTWQGDDGTSPTDWATAENWSNGLPTSDTNVTIPNVTNKPIIGGSTNALSNDVTIDASSSLSISGGGSLTASGNLTNNGTLTVNAAASLIVSGTSSGNFTYNVNVGDTNWHLISAPVEGEQYDDAWNTANSINVSGLGLNDGVSTYDNTTDADGNWDYFQTGGAATTFNTGQGYSLLRTAAGDYGFIGTMKTTDASIGITANDIGGAGENRWNLVGNPFPSFMSIDDFLGLAANATALEDSREAVYVWNGTAYAAVTTGYLHPGQGFFVNSNVASTSVAINESMLSHQTGITFYRNANTNPSIELMLSDGQNTKTTEIRYEDGKTTGLDPRFDIGTFTGTSNSFHIYSHLISDSQGVDFMRQTLPNTNHESLVVPIGVNATSGEEISFTANALNIPNGLNVFIEDRDLGLYTQLDAPNASYSVTLSSDLNGIGRFYLHTNTQSALSTDSFDPNTVNIYNTSNTNLRITGLRSGNASLRIFDILGKQVFQTSFEASSLNDITLPNVKTGVYIIRLSTDRGTLNKKIVLNN